MSEHFRPRRAHPVGLVVPRQVDPSGVTGPTRTQASGSQWRRTTRGRAVPASAARSVEQRILEEAQRLPPGGAVGGWAALLLHGAAYAESDEPVPLVVGRTDNLAARPGTRVVRLAAPPQVVLRHGIPCVDPVTALLDVVHREARLRHRVVTIDMTLAAGVVTLAQLVAVVERLGATRLREALPLVDPRSASPMESWLRLVWVLDAGLPVPRSNWPLFDLQGAAGTPRPRERGDRCVRGVRRRRPCRLRSASRRLRAARRLPPRRPGGGHGRRGLGTRGCRHPAAARRSRPVGGVDA